MQIVSHALFLCGAFHVQNTLVAYINLRQCYMLITFLLHGELPQRRHGGEHLLIEIFYAGNSKWLNALQFLQAEEEYEPR